MPDHHLHGNFTRCTACELRQQEMDPALVLRPTIPCQICDGSGHVPLTAADIVRAMAEEICRSYWPAFEARIA